MKQILLSLIPLYIALELLSDLRLPAIARQIRDQWPTQYQRIGYAESDGAYRHALRTNFVLPFLRDMGELPVVLRAEIRAFAVFRVVAICYFVIVVGLLLRGAS